MDEKKKLLFVSLYWKSTSGLAVILLTLIAFFTYFNVEQMKELQNYQRTVNQQQYIVEYNGLLKKTALQLTNLIDGIPGLTPEQKSIQEKIEQHWLSLQITWALESAALINLQGDTIAQWGDKRISPKTDSIKGP